MNNKTVRIVFGVLLTLIGLIFLFDAASVAFNGAIENWYIVLLAFLASMSLAEALARKRMIMLIPTATFVGIMTSLTLLGEGITFADTWCLIPISIGVGMLLYWLFENRNRKILLAACGLILIFVALFIGIWMKVWQYVLPSVLVALGLLIAICNIVNIDKKKVGEEADYYVTPSKDKKEKNE